MPPGQSLGTGSGVLVAPGIIVTNAHVIEGADQLLSADSQKQKEDLFSEFFANPSLTPEDAQKRFAEIIASAE